MGERMLLLPLRNGKEVWVNARFVASVRPNGAGVSLVWVQGERDEYLRVELSAEAVVDAMTKTEGA